MNSDMLHRRYWTVLLSAALILFSASKSPAEINWLGDYYQFRYTAINEPTFYYYDPGDPLFVQPYSSDVKHEDNAAFNSVASDQIREFVGNPLPTSSAQLKVGAYGPDSGINPDDGLMVQAYVDTTITDLNSEQGCDISQEARTFVVRRFNVNQSKDYRVYIELSGTADYNDFFVSNHYQADYIVSGEVEIFQILDGDEVSLLPGFPVDLDEDHRRAGIDISLRPFDDQQRQIIYQIKVLLSLQSRIDNFELNGFHVAGEINGIYRVGTAAAPFQLTAIIGDKSTALPAIPLLLLSD
jgi:hypothetical protein